MPSSRASRLLDFGYVVAAAAWRRLLWRTRVIAVTGSYGKTTAMRCLGSMLRSVGPTSFDPSGRNNRRALSLRLLRTRLSDRFAPIETGTNLPGALPRAALLVDPDIVVELAVDRVHSHNFENLEAIAAEKASLLSRQSRRGVAVLNADDPRVLAMREKARGRVLTFGRSPGCDLRATEVEARWPERLSFTACFEGASRRVETQLVGEHWTYSVLGALGAAVAAGVPLEQAAGAVRTVPPAPGRMYPVELPSGAWIVRDEFNESISTLDPALDVLRQARGVRRIAVLAEHYDSPLDPRGLLEDIGRRAAAAADLVVFVGKRLGPSKKAAIAAGMSPDAVHGCKNIWAAGDFLRAELRPGDLVLLRGCGQRHFERIYFRQFGSFGCPKSRCSLKRPCDVCSQLGLTLDPEVARSGQRPEAPREEVLGVSG